MVILSHCIWEIGMKREAIGILATVAILVGAFSLLAIPWFVQNGPFSSCSFGVSGTNAKIKVSGLSSSKFCQSAVQADATHYYTVDGSIDEPEVCSYKINALTLDVYDSGLFDIEGNAFCKYYNYASLCGFDAANALGAIGAVSAYPSQCPSTASSAATATYCFVGVPGHDAVIRFHGSDASQQCDAFIARNPSEYAYVDGILNQREICEGSIGNGDFAVFDNGGAFYGNQMCEALSVTPTP